ncbi:DegT/DnrJ/EryC1/StrS family aminotransferase [Cyanobacterium aponinum]|uniref:Glutamine--scyllo-inositol transaminase n=1 Tax=Cyanobacterium aponinum (strain PCC 10605) TaxID=755178 RepID=K9Z409_CYAAP|nr:DegT/DnrJ/EryC1/StrS family aminotransferase [Cyanobacterium aponinum]AFZ53305.1 Glutamine--scyllo-inositol transaminase [Cyanobacterium aponinum PCC 10605]
MTLISDNLKTKIEDLAIFGGKPLFSEKQHVGRPNLGDRTQFLNRINDMLDLNWLTNRGPFVKEFEQKIADYLGVKHCVSVCNATIALELAIRALELTGEVIIPSFTFIATAHALQWQEITPVFCDIDPITHTIDPDKIESMITPRTTGIIGVHVWGQPCNIEALTTIAKKHNLKLMFDAAHAMGCSYQGKMIGSFGDAEVLSFHATKFLNSFEGGAIVTNNDELAEKLILMENFGFSGLDNVIYIGTNGKMSEVCAAMGLTSLESINEFIEINHQNYQCYQQELKDIKGIKLFTYNQQEQCNYQYIVLEIDEEITNISRDKFVDILTAENIIARRYFYPGCHRMQPYKSYFPHAGLLLPETEKLSNKVMLLPTGVNMNPDKIIKITDLIKFILDNTCSIANKDNK